MLILQWVENVKLTRNAKGKNENVTFPKFVKFADVSFFRAWTELYAMIPRKSLKLAPESILG